MGLNGIQGSNGVNSVNVSAGRIETPKDNKYEADTVTHETLALDPRAMLGMSQIYKTEKPKVTIEEVKARKDDVASSTNIIRNLMDNIKKGEKTNLDAFKNIPIEDLKCILDEIYLFDQINLAYVLNNAKPGSIIETALSDKTKNIMQGFQSDKIDVFDDERGVFLINKAATKIMISENIDFFKQRLNLDSEASVEDIYSMLTDKDDSILSKTPKEYNDIFGMVMGYPKASTRIFELERNIPNFEPKDRHASDLTDYKDKLKIALYSEDSVYKNMSKEFKDDLAAKIDTIKEVTSAKDYFGSASGYPFVSYINEAEEISKIQDCIIACGDKMETQIRNAEEKERAEKLAAMKEAHPDIYAFLSQRESTNLFGEKVKSFTEENIENMMLLCEKKPEIIMELASKKTTDVSGNEKYKFSFDEITSLKYMHDEMPDAYKDYMDNLDNNSKNAHNNYMNNMYYGIPNGYQGFI